MRKFISIFMVVLATLIMLCACEPTIGDDGGEDEDRRVIELTFEIETLEAQVNGADSSTDLNALKDWADSCQLKIDTLKIEGKFEGLDALESRIEAVKNLIEVKRYPKAIYSEEEIEEYLDWRAENKTYEAGYRVIDGVWSMGPDFTRRTDGDVADVQNKILHEMTDYNWVTKDIVEICKYTSSGAKYTYVCTTDKEEDAHAIAKSKITFPISLNFYEDYEEAFSFLEGGKTYLLSDGDTYGVVWDDARIEEMGSYDTYDGIISHEGVLSIIEEGIIMCTNPNYTQCICTEEKLERCRELLNK